jgi:hypothetical protein
VKKEIFKAGKMPDNNMGKKASEEQKERINKRKGFSILDDLEIEVEKSELTVQKPISKRKRTGLELLRDLD